jgi:Fe-S cluster biosynthesis and repair protein YggX
MSHTERIAQWENMTAADPDNDMGWFSLGTAYKDAERYADAVSALGRAIQINPSMSRAYQLRGQALMALNRNDEAGDMLTRGYIIAAERGDVMPQRAMGSLLEKLGLPVPQVKKAEPEPAEDLGDNAIRDRRTGELQRRLPDPPMRGPTGKFIHDHFGQATWREWIAMGTKVINELRLDFSNVNHQQLYEQHMLEWLGVTPEEIEAYAKKQGE